MNDLLSSIAEPVRRMLGPGAPEVYVATDNFSADRRFRWELYYGWDRAAQLLVVCGQNPSKASRERTDATVIRCARRAYVAGFGGLLMVNMFPFVATDPADLWAAGECAAEEDRNLTILASVAKLLDRPAVLFAPGGDPHPRHRAMMARVEALFRRHGVDLMCLGVTAAGYPRHPSRLGYDVPMEPWRGLPGAGA